MFFIEGGLCWGRLYILGLIYFTTAALMPLAPEYAPLVYGLLNACCFTWLATQSRRIAAGKHIQT